MFLGAQKSVELLRNPCILGHPRQRGTKSEVAASPLPSRGPKRGQNCSVTPAFSGVPNKGDKIRSGYLTPAFSGAQKRANRYITPAFSGFPNKGVEIRSGCLTPAFLGPHKWAEVLCNPYILGRPQQRGTKSEVATSPLPSKWPKRGQNCYVTLAFSGVPNKRERNQKWLPQPCLLRDPKEGGVAP